MTNKNGFKRLWISAFRGAVEQGTRPVDPGGAFRDRGVFRDELGARGQAAVADGIPCVREIDTCWSVLRLAFVKVT